MTALISINNMYNGKYLVTLNQRDYLIESQRGVKFVCVYKVEEFGLTNQKTGEIIYSENKGQTLCDYVVTEKFAKKLNWI